MRPTRISHAHIRRPVYDVAVRCVGKPSVQPEREISTVAGCGNAPAIEPVYIHGAPRRNFVDEVLVERVPEIGFPLGLV